MAKEIARLGILSLLLITTNAAAATVADLLISEVMVNPAAVSDTRGEWFELYNPTTEEIKDALPGNLCRCTGYGGILRAIQRYKDYRPGVSAGSSP